LVATRSTTRRAVHEAGGLVDAQDEQTAEHPWLPRAAVKSRAADRVLPVGVLGHAIAGFIAGDTLPPSSPHAAAEPTGRRDGRFRH
jgi:chemotaxis response regulator CheB